MHIAKTDKTIIMAVNKKKIDTNELPDINSNSVVKYDIKLAEFELSFEYSEFVEVSKLLFWSLALRDFSSVMKL